MSSTEKIQLKTPEEKESLVVSKTVEGEQRRPGRPKKVANPETQKEFMIFLLDIFDGVTKEDNKYIIDKNLVNSENNIKITKEKGLDIKRIFPYCDFAGRMGQKSPVFTLLKHLSKIANYKIERFVGPDYKTKYILQLI